MTSSTVAPIRDPRKPDVVCGETSITSGYTAKSELEADEGHDTGPPIDCWHIYSGVRGIYPRSYDVP